MITTNINTGLLANVQRLRESDQNQNARLEQLEKRLAAIEQALTEPLPDEQKNGHEFTADQKRAIVKEINALETTEERDAAYKKYGISRAFFAQWKRMVNDGRL